jgi:hypothetical protein
MLVVAAAAAALIYEEQVQTRRDEQIETFQRLTGGIGFGPALELSTCTFGFDPRLDGVCSQQHYPIPGGGCFCPRHASSIFFYRPLEQGWHMSAEGGDRAPSP